MLGAEFRTMRDKKGTPKWSLPVVGLQSTGSTEGTLVEGAALEGRVRGDSFWGGYLPRVLAPECDRGLHLGVFGKPYLSAVLGGRKTLESRFSKRRIAPFGVVSPGDVILVKEVAGPIRGLVLAQYVWFFYLGLSPIRTIRERFEAGICADASFWERNREARFATVIQLAEPFAIRPLDCGKRDRRGWVALRPRERQLALWGPAE